MEVTQTIQLSEDERLAIQKVLGLCDEIADVVSCSMLDVFDYLRANAEVVEDYKYSIGDTLYIAEIG